MRAEELASSGDFEREHWIYVIKSSKKVQDTNFLSELIEQKAEFTPKTRELTSFPVQKQFAFLNLSVLTFQCSVSECEVIFYLIMDKQWF